jgi:hypothetical protein
MADPHWHEQNPWKDTLIYVPIEDLAACWFNLDAPGNRWDMIEIISHWTQYGGDKLDAYILTGGPVLTGGVRYGPESHHYLSPGFSLPKLYALMRQHVDIEPKNKITSSP